MPNANDQGTGPTESQETNPQPQQPQGTHNDGTEANDLAPGTTIQSETGDDSGSSSLTPIDATEHNAGTVRYRRPFRVADREHDTEYDEELDKAGAYDWEFRPNQWT